MRFIKGHKKCIETSVQLLVKEVSKLKEKHDWGCFDVLALGDFSGKKFPREEFQNIWFYNQEDLS